MVTPWFFDYVRVCFRGMGNLKRFFKKPPRLKKIGPYLVKQGDNEWTRNGGYIDHNLKNGGWTAMNDGNKLGYVPILGIGSEFIMRFQTIATTPSR